ncbi:TetR/AcrR family transcriptional regulator [Pseudarthrobacter sp. J1738]|uniref:TetR/AcrR family transcriptional regulator n=1 Tax=Pseudarthrobacter sp. J1738 TaxID=3420446 RepID=UPI003D2BF78F
MARPPKPERKTELLAEILTYLLNKSVADLTFRSLADGLGISSYVLVYHFGNREQLVGEIVRSIESRQDHIKHADVSQVSREQFAEWLNNAWQWCLQQRNRNLQRLEFEASMQDLVLPVQRGDAQESFRLWFEVARNWLRVQGVSDAVAVTDARLFAASFYGLQYDYVVMNDADAATAAFSRMVDVFFQNLDFRLGKSDLPGFTGGVSVAGGSSDGGSSDGANAATTAPADA